MARLPLESLSPSLQTKSGMLTFLTALKGWAFNVAMLSLIAVAVLVTHAVFRFVEWLTRARRL